MKNYLPIIFKYLPLSLGILILTVGSLFVPWKEVGPYLATIDLITGTTIVLLGIAFYFARVFRYGYMLRVLGKEMPFSKLAVAYFVSQPVSLLPAGEIYRSVMLKKHGNVPMVSGVPVVIVQSFTENIGLLVIALCGAIFLNTYLIAVVIVAILYALVLRSVHLNRETHKRGLKLISKLPFVNISKYKFFSFIEKNQTLLSGKTFFVLLFSSFISSFFAITALLLAANSFGVELSFVEAAIAYSIPLIIQNLTFLPGGLGVNEQSSVGVLVLIGVGLPAAVALTIVVRMITLVIGVVLGIIAIGYAKASKNHKS